MQNDVGVMEITDKEILVKTGTDLEIDCYTRGTAKTQIGKDLKHPRVVMISTTGVYVWQIVAHGLKSTRIQVDLKVQEGFYDQRSSSVRAVLCAGDEEQEEAVEKTEGWQKIEFRVTNLEDTMYLLKIKVMTLNPVCEVEIGSITVSELEP